MKKGYKWVHIIEEEFCTGCGLCVEACGPECLEVPDGVVARRDLVSYYGKEYLEEESYD